MRLFEMYDPSPEGIQDLSQDNSRPQWGNTRKTKLTLEQINKLRRMTEVRNYEYVKNLKKIKRQYAPPAQPTL